MTANYCPSPKKVCERVLPITKFYLFPGLLTILLSELIDNTIRVLALLTFMLRKIFFWPILMLTFWMLANLSTSQVCFLSFCQLGRPQILLVHQYRANGNSVEWFFHSLSMRENTCQYKQKLEISNLTLQNVVLTPGKFCVVRQINKNSNSMN